MRVLAITNMYPHPLQPTHGVFVEQQVLGLRRTGVDVEVVFIDRVTRGMRAYFDMDPPVDRALGRHHVDVVHVMYGGIMAERLLRRRWAQPVVVTFHGSDVFGENLSGWKRRAISYVGVMGSRHAARRATGVVAVSKVVAGALPRSLDPKKVRIIPCGIDLDRFVPLDRAECRRQLGWAPDHFHVLFPANAGDPVKRPELAAAAVSRLASAGVPVELHHLRGIPNSLVPQWLNASDALLLTSRHEGSPTVVKEALACNVAVVSVDVGDVAERIQGIEGCHLAAPEADDLAAKLGLVAAAGARVNSRAHIGSLSHLAVAHDLRRFYSELLGQSHG
ncbi:MAG: glycosyltransferase [Vicinamibacterales bacterium]